jgi:tRNA (adenine57-N1/adenine58-N1)-methyltransferase
LDHKRTDRALSAPGENDGPSSATSSSPPSTNRGTVSSTIRRGDVVLFRWHRSEALAEVTDKGARVEGLGVFKETTVVGQPWGAAITVGAQTVRLLQPSLPDFVRLMKRGAQIVTLKDAGAILAHCAIGAGSFVVEFGVGSGALTLSILHAVGAHGRLISVDNNARHIDIAKRNVERTPWGAPWQMREADCKAGIPETGADAVVIDIPDPWEAVPAAQRALGVSGRLGSFSPTINQTERMAVALEKAAFSDVRTIELIEREHVVREGSSRPSFEMLGHTGYLTFARRAD